jgi:peptidyl-prolyl cis-trans isomerase SurA
MRFKLAAVYLLGSLAFPVIIDRVAITVNKDLIKDSDINRDLLATQLLNGDAPNLSPAARKKDAAHLIDQVFIREEIRVGAYAIATMEEAEAELDGLEKERFKTKSEFNAALKRYQLSEPDLREQFRWQLTVLKFIDTRFRPAVLITDEQVDAYYKQHMAQLKKQNPKGEEDDLKSDARDILTGDQVNKLLFDWLDQRRHDAKVHYLEAPLG